MRIAISGTHSVGKSTLVSDFLRSKPNYIHEEEPYRMLRNFYDIKFGKKSTRYHNGLQLYYNLARVLTYRSSKDNVIFDRCPIDYIAYSLYTAHHHQTDIDSAFVESMVDAVREAIQQIDMIVFIPLTKKHPIQLEDDGIRLIDKDYRIKVDTLFKTIYRDNRFNLMSKAPLTKLVEAWGPREQRIEQISSILNE